MNKTLIYVALLVLGGLIIVIIAGDFLKNRFEKPAANPYAFNVDGFKEIDPSLIHYREISRIALNIENPKSIAWHKGFLCIAYQDHLQIIDSLGVEVVRKTLPDTAGCIAVSPSGEVYIGYRNYIEIFDLEGNAQQKWDTLSGNPFLTAIAFKNDAVFVADAGNRRVYRYAHSGDLLNFIEGKGRIEGTYGFVIPSPYFDLVVDPDDELWVVNPGIHHVENYTDEGALRAFWGDASFDIDGFTGCCNPVHIAVLQDGKFITSEKGLVRIKVFKASGELDCVVAGPDAFDENAEGPDIATDNRGRVYVLDYNRNLIRIFENKTS